MSNYDNSGSRNYSSFGGGYGSQLNNPVQTGDVRRSVLQAYLWMFAGLLLTALVSYVFYKTGWMLALMQSPVISILLVVVQLGLAIAFGIAMAKASVQTLGAMFIAYAFTMGISLSSIFYVYTNSVIFAAFLVSALYFGCLAFVGFTTKIDMSRFGPLLMIGLLVLLVSQLIMMLFGVSMSVRLYSIIGLLLFTGITIWDVQRLNTTMLYAQGQPVAQQKWAIFFALQLYLDFINIFMYILQLMGNNSRKN
jgi:FtsH-binding integral membrane protein